MPTTSTVDTELPRSRGNGSTAARSASSNACTLSLLDALRDTQSPAYLPAATKQHILVSCCLAKVLLLLSYHGADLNSLTCTHRHSWLAAASTVGTGPQAGPDAYTHRQPASASPILPAFPPLLRPACIYKEPASLSGTLHPIWPQLLTTLRGSW